MFINGYDFDKTPTDSDDNVMDLIKLVDPSCVGDYEECEYGQDNAITSFKEMDVNGMFSLKDENDKIVDFSIGTTSEQFEVTVDDQKVQKRQLLIAVVTESGKCYARGAELYETLKYNSRHGEAKDCFEVKIIEGKNNWLARKVFLCQKQTLMIISVEDKTNGKWTNVGFGATDAFHGVSYKGAAE